MMLRIFMRALCGFGFQRLVVRLVEIVALASPSTAGPMAVPKIRDVLIPCMPTLANQIVVVHHFTCWASHSTFYILRGGTVCIPSETENLRDHRTTSHAPTSRRLATSLHLLSFEGGEIEFL